jgi:hypothetical protein
MIRLNRRLIAIGGLMMLIAAGAILNALDADVQNPLGHDVGVVPEDTERMSRPADDSSADATVHALFNFHHTETAPFPSDVFTVADHSHNTGRIDVRISAVPRLLELKAASALSRGPSIMPIVLWPGVLLSKRVFLITQGGQ